MMESRIEHDLLGDERVPADALYGIHTLRATMNFRISGRLVNPALIHAYGAVKLACAMTNHALGRWDDGTYGAIERACGEMIRKELDTHIVVDALQGGAGTSTNMNVNEVLANRALQFLGRRPGEYALLHPIGDINLHQSTNDTYPTALKVAAINGLRSLEFELVPLLETFQRKEKEMAHVVKIGRTQLQDAVLTTMGRTMSAFAEAMGRDRWRVFKCEERLRVVNLGGTAIGTGLGAPRKYIFKVVENLKMITGIGLSRAENLVDVTQNADVFVEVSGILKTCASNLLKICGDLRLMSSGPKAGLGELRLPPLQAGSTMMPGKVNPVVPEAVSQAAMAVMANDTAITMACSMGNLELNAFLPLVADCLLHSLDLLVNACRTLRELSIENLAVDEENCRRQVDNSTATVTALVDVIGYEAAQEVSQEAAVGKVSVKDIIVGKGLMSSLDFDHLVAPEVVTRLGSG